MFCLCFVCVCRACVCVCAVFQGDEPVSMGSFTDMYCFANEPYECEFVYDLATIVHDGEFKCQVCDMEGVRQLGSSDDDFLG